LAFFIVGKSFAQKLFTVIKELNIRDVYFKAWKAINSILAMMSMMTDHLDMYQSRLNLCDPYHLISLPLDFVDFVDFLIMLYYPG
jgi:hypothetical protein